ncbi:putative ABC transport system permease protein [Haloactinospora alba]|uniref:Putative ABC transport system permease protein n=2 Tax=Haloactinospora alba TaxID=405555 RepID=A0A543NL74_9ACTN|nr:putative ABC transport system permease protein [Haloactinospora alba]
MIADSWAQLRAYPARLVAIVLAVTLGVGFLAATAVFSSTSSAGLRSVAAAPLTGADVYVEATEEPSSGQWLEHVRKRPDVASANPSHARTVQARTGGQRLTATALTLPADPQLRWFDLASGSWPEETDEVMADSAALSDAGLDVGSTLEMRLPSGETRTVTVTGATDLGFTPLAGVDMQFYAPAAFFGDTAPQQALVRVAEGTEIPGVAEGIDSALGSGFRAVAAADQADAAATKFVGGTTEMTAIILAFAFVALLAAAMVIANTFTILLAQRRRQTALLRLVGAHRRQVRALVLTEAGMLGGLGSLLGLVLGSVLGYVGATLMGLAGGGMRANPLALLACVAAGVVITLCAAWLPARRAMAVAPAEALQDAAAEETATPGHVAGLVAVGAGAVLAVAGGVTGALPLTVGGGALSAVGLLARLGTTAELAGANLRRAPRRSATTVTALVLGTALIAALSVAAVSGQATVDADLDRRYPVDASVQATDGSISPDTVARMRDIDGLTRVEPVTTADVEVTAGGAGEPVPTIVGASPEMARAAGEEQLADATADPPVMLLPPDRMSALEAADSDTVRVSVGAESRRFRVSGSELASVSAGETAVVARKVLAGMDLGTETGTVWGVAQDGADRDALSTAMNRVAAQDLGITVSGALSERTDIANVLDILLNLALAMLAVTVLIAVVGVANTLGLSVLERRRETALLRALGLRRRRLQATLALEGAALALLGALLGVVIGVPYGLLGIDAVVGGKASLVVELSWGRLALVVVAAVGACVLASALPARQAARAEPSEALTG